MIFEINTQQTEKINSNAKLIWLKFEIFVVRCAIAEAEKKVNLLLHLIPRFNSLFHWPRNKVGCGSRDSDDSKREKTKKRNLKPLSWMLIKAGAAHNI